MAKSFLGYITAQTITQKRIKHGGFREPRIVRNAWSMGYREKNRQTRPERQLGLDSRVLVCRAKGPIESNTVKTSCGEFHCQVSLKLTVSSSFKWAGRVEDRRIVFLPVSWEIAIGAVN